MKRHAEGSAPAKSLRIDPDLPATEPSSKHARWSAAGNWIGSLRFTLSIVGAERAVAKTGDEVEVCERRMAMK